MTKGLHKNSLRKVDNPHQWMIDDARMELIQQIKAEMERRIKSWQTRGEHSPEGQGKDTCVSRVTELTDLLSFLSDLEKSEKPINPTIEKIRALINMQIRREELNFASLGGGGQTMNIGALEWVLKQLDTLQEQPVKPSVEDAMKELDKKIAKATKSWKGVDVDKMLAECRGYDEQPVCEVEDEEYEQIKQKVCLDCPSHKDDYCGYVKRQLQRKCNYLSDVMYGYELGRQSKPTTAEGLEEEINRLSKNEYFDFADWKAIARHFAQWGAEHLKK